MKLSQFICPLQLKTLNSLKRGEEGAFFREKEKEIIEVLETIPSLYEQEDLGDKALYFLRYFAGGSALWYISEIGEPDEDGNIIAFGYADLGYGGELGYISITELLSVGAEMDFYWTAKTLKEIKGNKSDG